ncbi:NADH-quinone oxidoreductase subunit J [Thermoactinomyces sp. DSM 45892]|uniref:NADH-quinone oxidoreductase subunit J n=1 Tax=Thermoactinomyces sp. DSM 45892 TaxID=1882753 RepID=UPI00089CFE24|nr:NADH-quinone oxidoreductase subunit J [Thermoactinomyces sp. DSM 45892]SDZ21846.1 NADH-quinone oxidoreductase subunit J [Thermoactinomyces sp. DSM 45892]
MEITGEFIAFFILSVLAICGSVFMIFFTNVVHMGVSMAFTFLSIAGIYFLLNADFLAVIQIMVYTGAISILMLFGIMMTRHKETEETLNRPVHYWLSIAGAGVLLVSLVLLSRRATFVSDATNPNGYGIEKIGELFFGTYMIPFELASILLLVALIGSIIMAKKEGQE